MAIDSFVGGPSFIIPQQSAEREAYARAIGLASEHATSQTAMEIPTADTKATPTGALTPKP